MLTEDLNGKWGENAGVWVRRRAWRALMAHS